MGVNFANVSTTTPGKINVIKWQKRVIKNHFNGKKMDGYAVCIPGNGDQLERHIQEMIDYGVDEDKIIMVDHSYEVYLSLLEAADVLGFTGEVRYGDMLAITRELWAQGKQVDVIDHDNVAFLEKKYVDFMQEAMKNGVKIFIEVFQTRGNRGGLPYYLRQWADTLEIEQYEHRRGNMAWPWGEIQMRAVECVASAGGYSHYERPYLGRVTMHSNLILSKN